MSGPFRCRCCPFLDTAAKKDDDDDDDSSKLEDDEAGSDWGGSFRLRPPPPLLLLFLFLQVLFLLNMSLTALRLTDSAAVGGDDSKKGSFGFTCSSFCSCCRLFPFSSSSLLSAANKMERAGLSSTAPTASSNSIMGVSRPEVGLAVPSPPPAAAGFLSVVPIFSNVVVSLLLPSFPLFVPLAAATAVAVLLLLEDVSIIESEEDEAEDDEEEEDDVDESLSSVSSSLSSSPPLSTCIRSQSICR